MAGPGAIAPPGMGFNPRGMGGGQPPPPNDPVKETVQKALDQARGAASAIGTFRKHSTTSMQELASRGKDPNIHRVVTNIISSEGTSSLQMTYNGSAIAIAENSVTKMAKPRGGWFSRKRGTVRTIIEQKVSKTKNPGIKTYYGPKGPANAFLDASYGISQAAEAVFKAKNGSVLESSAKSALATAADGVIKLADKVTPDNANNIATLVGTVQGLIEATGAKVDDKKATALKVVGDTTNEFDSAKEVAQQKAKELADMAKQSPEPTAQAA